MLRLFKDWFSRTVFGERPCCHPNALCYKWLDKDGSPMIDFRCPDCGEANYGLVDADPETWTSEPQTRP